MLTEYRVNLTAAQAFRKRHLDVETPNGTKTFHRDEASDQWDVPVQSYLVISSMKGYPIYEAEVVREAVPA